MGFVGGQLQLIFTDGEVDGAVLDVDPVVVVGHLHLDPGEGVLGGDDVHLRHQLLQLLLGRFQLFIQQLALLEALGPDQLDLLQGLGIALVAWQLQQLEQQVLQLVQLLPALLLALAQRLLLLLMVK